MCSKGIKSEKPSGNSPSSKAVGEQAVFLIFKRGIDRDEEVDSGGDLVVVGCTGTKQHYACVFESIKSEKPSGNSPLLKAVREQAVF